MRAFFGDVDICYECDQSGHKTYQRHTLDAPDAILSVFQWHPRTFLPLPPIAWPPYQYHHNSGHMRPPFCKGKEVRPQVVELQRKKGRTFLLESTPHTD